MTVYLYACYWTEWEEVAHYLRSTLQRVMADWDCTMLIRNSTGQLSADLVPPDRSEQYTISLGNTSFGISLPSTFISSSVAAQEALAIDSLTPDSAGKIADPVLYQSCRADEVFNTEIVFSVVSEDPQTWLSQANHIFSRLQITSNLEDYDLVDEVDFTIVISSPTEVVPPGFLFLCPEEFFSWQGVSNKPAEDQSNGPSEAASLGFPAIQRITKSYGPSWPTSVYAGLRQFHEAKGFDPESQGIARDLRKRLYQLSHETNPSFAHVEELSRAEEDGDEVDTDEEWEDAQSSLHDGNELAEEFETENRQGEVNVHSEGHGKNEAPREPVDHESHTDQGIHPESEISNDSLTGHFIRIIRALRLGEGLDVEAETTETDPISPYLV
ncbi:hypothetical protein B0H16DRAFT_1737003 [Mycena metata]|uniref:Uncharacterized protein n=1 Tax=Mycena metata TaxID=1033252 RepID=A0AAD7HMD6_9AGAR|nr:hypothetical protein B0H16DRAFT_1737003 [Mycena metata]